MKNKQRGFGLLVELLIYAAIFAAVSAAAWAMWSSFTEGYRDEGRAEIRAEFAPLIEECTKANAPPATCADMWRGAVRDSATAQSNFDRCSAAAGEQSKAVADAATQAKAAKDDARRILAAIELRSKATEAKIDEFKRAAASPAANEIEACNEAKRVLADLRTVRLRYYGASPASAGSANRDGENPGPDSLRIGR